MPFGLMNAGATFQRKVDRAVADLEAVFAYVDDMDVASRDAEEHAVHLRQLFTRLREHGLVINVEKCVFGASSIQFLGHHLSAEGVDGRDGGRAGVLPGGAEGGGQPSSTGPAAADPRGGYPV